MRTAGSAGDGSGGRIESPAGCEGCAGGGVIGWAHIAPPAERATAAPPLLERRVALSPLAAAQATMEPSSTRAASASAREAALNLVAAPPRIARKLSSATASATRRRAVLVGASASAASAAARAFPALWRNAAARSSPRESLVRRGWQASGRACNRESRPCAPRLRRSCGAGRGIAWPTPTPKGPRRWCILPEPWGSIRRPLCPGSRLRKGLVGSGAPIPFGGLRRFRRRRPRRGPRDIRDIVCHCFGANSGAILAQGSTAQGAALASPCRGMSKRIVCR